MAPAQLLTAAPHAQLVLEVHGCVQTDQLPDEVGHCAASEPALDAVPLNERDV